MKKLFALSFAALAAAGCMYQEPAGLSASDEAQLSQELRGLAAGQPVNCVSLRDIRDNHSAGHNAIVFESRDDTIYVNRPAGSCPLVNDRRVLLTESATNRLCAGDAATVVNLSGQSMGTCTLGQFTPYRRGS